jgi:asparagine synthase (glutamine-hydrolysing)
MSSDARSDAEIVLAAYRLWSDHCPSHLLGDFAFAVLDLSRHRLFCARDHIGARQLYYIINDRFFAFASDDEALLNIPGVSNEPYDDLVAHYLVPDFQDFDPMQTWLRDVRGLKAAHYLVITPAGASQPMPYWQFELVDEKQYDNDQECEAAFLDVLGSAVQSRLRMNDHPAAIISGGMDSGSISAMLRRLLPEQRGGRFHSYSLIADDLASSLESRCIQSMTQRRGVIANTVSVPSFSGMLSVEDLAKVVWKKAHPIDNSIMVVSSMCFAAVGNGHRVLLHGVSGDLTMGNPAMYVAPLLRSFQWRAGWQECNAAAQNYTHLQDYSALQILFKNALVAFTPSVVKNQWRQIRRRVKGVKTETDLLNPEFARKLDVPNRLGLKAAQYRSIAGSGYRHEHAASVFSETGVLSGLSGYQRTAAKFGVEMRDPWADKRVLEFFLHLPMNQLVRNGWTKYLARSTFERDLGKQVVWRNDKEHLGWMLFRPLMEESKEFIEHSMNDELNLIEDYVDTSKVRDSYALYKQNKDPEKIMFVYNMMTLIQWIKRISAS